MAYKTIAHKKLMLTQCGCISFSFFLIDIYIYMCVWVCVSTGLSVRQAKCIWTYLNSIAMAITNAFLYIYEQ